MEDQPKTPTAWATHPLLVAAITGVALAWPVDPWHDEERSIAAVVLGVALASCDPTTRPRWLRILATVSIAGLMALAIGQRTQQPGLGLVILVSGTLTFGWVWKLLGQEQTPAPARSANGPAIGLSLLAVFLAERLGPPPEAVVGVLALVAVATVLADRARYPLGFPDLLESLLASPARLLVASFTTIAAVGTALLLFPAMSVREGSLSFVDAAFTSMSATCVTGLIVLDTPNDFTGLGQLVILLLIQVGGLGIMSFATAASVFLGRRLGVREEAMAAEMMGGRGTRRDLEAALNTVFRVTLVSELLGTVALTPLFMAQGDAVGSALWRALFTAISAFCNAGFALQPDSLMRYAQSPLVLLTISALIVVGGLGPTVVGALPSFARSGRSSLHVRLVLVSSVVLLVVPMGAFLALEWSNTLDGLGLFDKITNAWFQSVTLRTAGFNSVDIALIRPATWTLMLVCMFIGGSPGSTAGGVKTTTMAVLLLAVTAAIRGRHEAAAFGRRIPHRTVYEATAITTIGVLTATAVLAALQLTQPIALDSALFEVVSALGTVGLSMGATGQLDEVGKVLIIAVMFAGRVGPLTLFIFFAGSRRPGRRHPFEAVQVG